MKLKPLPRFARVRLIRRGPLATLLCEGCWRAGDVVLVRPGPVCCAHSVRCDRQCDEISVVNVAHSRNCPVAGHLALELPREMLPREMRIRRRAQEAA